jgi:lysozyme family protein
MIDFPGDFLKALTFSLKWEVGADMKNGGYTNNPKDPGGETKWGISKRSYPHLDIANLTLDQAREIYYADYWQAKGNQESFCSEMPWPLNLVHFDCAVNIGNRKTAKDGSAVLHRRANMLLQRALGVDDDGWIGPVTYKAIAEGDPLRLALKALTQRDFYYSTLGSWAHEFTRGWLRRTNDLRATVMHTTAPKLAMQASGGMN